MISKKRVVMLHACTKLAITWEVIAATVHGSLGMKFTRSSSRFSGLVLDWTKCNKLQANVYVI